jgi:hypothetical protein
MTQEAHGSKRPAFSKRQWDTVREDYSLDGNAGTYFSRDPAGSRAYRWGEDGLGGISDEKQILCFALVKGAKAMESVSGSKPR